MYSNNTVRATISLMDQAKSKNKSRQNPSSQA